MTTSVFRYIDSSSIQDDGWGAWTKVDSDVTCYKRTQRRRCVTNIGTWKLQFGTDISGFDAFDSPATETSFTDDVAVRTSYYAEAESLLRAKLPGVKKVSTYLLSGRSGKWLFKIWLRFDLPRLVRQVYRSVKIASLLNQDSHRHTRVYIA